jgi:hypothetical protein
MKNVCVLGRVFDLVRLGGCTDETLAGFLSMSWGWLDHPMRALSSSLDNLKESFIDRFTGAQTPN